MITTQGLAGLRIAATLVHGVPGLHLSVRGANGGVAAEVGWSAGRHETCADRATVLSPCAFRKAVSEAHALHERGRRMAFLDLEPGSDPDVEILLPARGAAFGGGIYRVPLDGRWLFAFGTTLDAPTCREIAADLVEEALPLDMLAALGVRSDEDTGVAIVYAETAVRVAPHPSRPLPSVVGTDDEERVVELLQAMLARLAAHELISEIEGAGVHQG